MSGGYKIFFPISAMIRQFYLPMLWNITGAQEGIFPYDDFPLLFKYVVKCSVSYNRVALYRPHIFSTCHLWKCRYHVYWNLLYLFSILKVIFLKSNPLWFKETLISFNITNNDAIKIHQSYLLQVASDKKFGQHFP
jgi:hypothetical protein